MTALPRQGISMQHTAMTVERPYTVVLDLRGLQWASQQAAASAVLGRHAGVVDVAVNPVAQSATVVYDPSVTSVAELRAWVQGVGTTARDSWCPTMYATPRRSRPPPWSRGAQIPAPIGRPPRIALPQRPQLCTGGTRMTGGRCGRSKR